MRKLSDHDFISLPIPAMARCFLRRLVRQSHRTESPAVSSFDPLEIPPLTLQDIERYYNSNQALRFTKLPHPVGYLLAGAVHSKSQFEVALHNPLTPLERHLSLHRDAVMILLSLGTRAEDVIDALCVCECDRIDSGPIQSSSDDIDQQQRLLQQICDRAMMFLFSSTDFKQSQRRHAQELWSHANSISHHTCPSATLPLRTSESLTGIAALLADSYSKLADAHARLLLQSSSSPPAQDGFTAKTRSFAYFLRGITADGLLTASAMKAVKSLTQELELTEHERRAAMDFAGIDDAKLSRMQQKSEAANSFSAECVVCLDKPRSFIVQPCFHLCLCGDCCKLIRNAQCPICAVRVQSVHQVFT